MANYAIATTMPYTITFYYVLGIAYYNAWYFAKGQDPSEGVQTLGILASTCIVRKLAKNDLYLSLQLLTPLASTLKYRLGYTCVISRYYLFQPIQFIVLHGNYHGILHTITL